MPRCPVLVKGSRLIAFAALIAAAALAAPSITFFVRDPRTAAYDLRAAVPPDALFFKGNYTTPYTGGPYYQFDSENGYDFYCHFIFADLGFGLKKYLVDYKLHYPDGTCKVFGGKFDQDEGFQAEDRFEWKIGPNRIKGDQAIHHLHIESGALRVDVDLKTLVPFYRVGDDGRIYLEPERKGWGQLTYFPLFAAQGTILDGETSIPVSGWGYGNLSRMHFIITEITSLHTALRWQKDGLGFDFHDYRAAPEYGGNWFGVLMVYDQGRMIHVSQDFRKEILESVTEPKTGFKIPIGYRLESRGQGVTVQIEFTGVRLADYNDPLVWLGGIEKRLVELVTEPPLDLRLDGQVKLTVTTDQGTIIKAGPGHGLALQSQ